MTAQPGEAAVYDFSMELSTTHETFQRAKQLLGEQQVIDLVGVNGTYVTVAMLLSVAEAGSSARQGAALQAGGTLISSGRFAVVRDGLPALEMLAEKGRAESGLSEPLCSRLFPCLAHPKLVHKIAEAVHAPAGAEGSHRRWTMAKVRRTSRSSTERAAVPPARQNPGRLYRESGLVPWRRADVGPTIALRLEAPGTGSYPPLALSLGRLGQQVSVDPVQRSHQHGCPMMLSRLEWQPLAARHSYQVALRSLWFGMGLQVRPQGVAGLSPPEASRWQRTGCPRGS